ncbi:MAG: hypothetical protein IJA47_02310, partial [Oscillospiraceae bacterium]|nr:hypothetical protein [Oscillospiraceae bacterium]
ACAPSTLTSFSALAVFFAAIYMLPFYHRIYSQYDKMVSRISLFFKGNREQMSVIFWDWDARGRFFSEKKATHATSIGAEGSV